MSDARHGLMERSAVVSCKWQTPAINSRATHVISTERRDLWSKKFSVRYHKLWVEHQKLYKRRSEMASVYRILKEISNSPHSSVWFIRRNVNVFKCKQSFLFAVCRSSF